MELMQAKLVRLLSKTHHWFNVFSEQLEYAAASARLGADTRVAQATAETLKIPGSADQAFVCRLPTGYSLHVVGEFWLLVLSKAVF